MSKADSLIRMKNDISTPPSQYFWHNTIWREWRNSHHPAYAEFLYDLVADEPLGRGAIRQFILFNLCRGGLLGLLLALLVSLFLHTSWQAILIIVLLGSAFFGIIPRLTASRMTWRSTLGWIWLISPYAFKRMRTVSYILFIWMAVGTLLSAVLPPGKTIWVIVGWSLCIPVLGIMIDVSKKQVSFPELNLLGAVMVFAYMFANIMITLSEGVNAIALTLGLMIIIFITLFQTDLHYGLNAEDLYSWRGWHIWWRKRPFPDELRAVIKQAALTPSADLKPWHKLLTYMQRAPKQPTNELVYRLSIDRWSDQFIARYGLEYIGGKAVEPLQRFAEAQTNQAVRRAALTVMNYIEEETSARLANVVDRLWCTDCLVKCTRHRVRLSFVDTLSFYGCRACYQSETFHYLDRVEIVLDRDRKNEQIEAHNYLYVNWFERDSLFDFDRVRIIHATDEEVERFAVQVGNDTNPVRQARYRQMRCRVEPDCLLSENTLRILRNTFGRVAVGSGEHAKSGIN